MASGVSPSAARKITSPRISTRLCPKGVGDKSHRLSTCLQVPAEKIVPLYVRDSVCRVGLTSTGLARGPSTGIIRLTLGGGLGCSSKRLRGRRCARPWAVWDEPIEAVGHALRWLRGRGMVAGDMRDSDSKLTSLPSRL